MKHSYLNNIVLLLRSIGLAISHKNCANAIKFSQHGLCSRFPRVVKKTANNKQLYFFKYLLSHLGSLVRACLQNYVGTFIVAITRVKIVRGRDPIRPVYLACNLGFSHFLSTNCMQSLHRAILISIGQNADSSVFCLL